MFSIFCPSYLSHLILSGCQENLEVPNIFIFQTWHTRENSGRNTQIFELKNHVHCFKHTLQLTAKTLLHPFNAGLGKTTEDHDNNNVESLSDEDIDDGIDEFEALEMDKHEEIMTATAAVHETVTKICVSLLTCNVLIIHVQQLHHLSFAIVWSTTIALPAWCHYCKDLKLKSCILPCDVVTCWNSTYYMLSFTVKYHTIIDALTTDKWLKLRQYELEMEEWAISKDLVTILLVSICIYQQLICW